MKKILALALALSVSAFVCGCEFNEDFNVSEIMDELESKYEVFTEEMSVSEIDFGEPFVYNTYYDSGYGELNEKQREIYENLYLIALQMPEGYVRLCNNYDGFYTDVSIAYNAMINDHPDFFWMPYTYIVGEMADMSGSYISIAFEIDDGENQNRYLVRRDERENMNNKLNSKIAEIVDLLVKCKGEYKKVEFLNDYLCDNTEYDQFADLNQTSYGCIVNGKALCEGYSRAFKLLCNKVGVRCDLIYGMSENVNHMWNCVNIGGEYSHIDVTWNDGKPEYRHLYFNITDEQLLKDHSIYPHFSNVADVAIDNSEIINFVDWKCDYTGNTYYAKNNLILKNDNIPQIARKIAKKASEGVYTIELLVEDAKILKQLENQNISAVKDIQQELVGIEIKQYSLVRDVLMLYFADN